MNINELKECLPEAVGHWAEERIDALVAERPELAVASAYLKRGAKNIVAAYGTRMGERLDAAALFLADENGNVDADTLTEDAAKMLDALPETPFKMGVFGGSVGAGRIRVALPDNILTTLLLGDRKTIAFGGEDISALAEYIKQATNETDKQ